MGRLPNLEKPSWHKHADRAARASSKSPSEGLLSGSAYPSIHCPKPPRAMQRHQTDPQDHLWLVWPQKLTGPNGLLPKHHPKHAGRLEAGPQGGHQIDLGLRGPLVPCGPRTYCRRRPPGRCGRRIEATRMAFRGSVAAAVAMPVMRS